MKRTELYQKKVEEMHKFDISFSTGIIAGMDEVGRGPLAGDVVCACVVMPSNILLPRVDDSKKLSEKARVEIDAMIREIALFIGIGKASPEEIDNINILNATRLAMKRACEGLKCDILLVDAVTGLDINVDYKSIISGDAKSYSIASASVIAKVERDKNISFLASKYPEYGFEKNKGYGTAEHIAALKKYGPCEIHRRSFIKNYV